jgi:hypothetical protein
MNEFKGVAVQYQTRGRNLEDSVTQLGKYTVY